jgi:uncharacterized membrane protein
MNHYVAPMFLWILINGAIAFVCKEQDFNNSVFLALFIFGVFIVTQKIQNPNLICSTDYHVPFIHVSCRIGIKVLFEVILTVLTLDYCCSFWGLKGNGRYYFFVLAICFF